MQRRDMISWTKEIFVDRKQLCPVSWTEGIFADCKQASVRWVIIKLDKRNTSRLQTIVCPLSTSVVCPVSTSVGNGSRAGSWFLNPNASFLHCSILLAELYINVLQLFRVTFAAVTLRWTQWKPRQTLQEDFPAQFHAFVPCSREC